MSIIGNIIWLVFGGLEAAVVYFFGGIALCLTIVGIPFGIMAIQMAGQVLLPFGKTVRRRERATGCISVFLSILWIISLGWILALGHVIFGAVLCITVIGIPFGLQHFKLIPIALDPFGSELV
jgi:uncharacterized membrane protein YccF (DUF307 family)